MLQSPPISEDAVHNVRDLVPEINLRLGELADQLHASRIGITVPRDNTDSGQPVELTIQEVLLPLMGNTTPSSTATLVDAGAILDGDAWTDLTDGGESTGHHHDSLYVNVTGDTMTGDLSIGGKQLLSVGHLAMTAVDDKIQWSATRYLTGTNGLELHDATAVYNYAPITYFIGTALDANMVIQLRRLAAAADSYIAMVGVADYLITGSLAGDLILYNSQSSRSIYMLASATGAFEVHPTGMILGNGSDGVDYTFTVNAGTNDYLQTWDEDNDVMYTSDAWLFGDAAKVYYEASGNTKGTEYDSSDADGYRDFHFATAARFYGPIELHPSGAATGNIPQFYNDDSFANWAIMYMYPADGTNVSSQIACVPMGTGGSATIMAQVTVFNTDVVADNINYDFVALRARETYCSLETADAGTGTTRPLHLLTKGNASQLILATDGNISMSGALNVGEIDSGEVELTHATANWLLWNTSGLGAPTYTTRSVGTKLVLYPFITAARADWAIGVESGYMWFSSADTTATWGFKWYTGTTERARLTGDGNWLLAGTAKHQYGDAGTFIQQGADGYLDLEADGAVRINTNAVFEADGTRVAMGDATTFNDLFMGFSGARVPAANAPNWESFIGNLNKYTFAVNDFLELDSIELEHTYKEDSNFYFHVHWATNGTEGAAKYVKWEIEYTIANADESGGVGDTFPATTVVSAETEIPASTADIANMYTAVASITGTNFNIGAILTVRVRRIASAGTAPVANPFGLMVGVHIEQDTDGSRTQTTK